MTKNLVRFAAVAAAMLLASAASATTVNFTYSGASLFGPQSLSSARLSFTFGDTLNSFGGYDVTGVTGDVDGDVITGMQATTGPNAYYPDALSSCNEWCAVNQTIFADWPRIDFYGLAFQSASTFYNFGYSGGYFLLSVPSDVRAFTPADFDVIPDFVSFSAGTATVPEPASWALLITGFGLTGAAMRRRRTVEVAA